MKLFSKAKSLFDGGRKEHRFDRKATDLINHVLCKDVDYIKTVDQNVLREARYEDGNTVLIKAIDTGNLNFCKEILKYCPSLLYHENKYNETVLHKAHRFSSVVGENFLFIDFFVSVGVDELKTSTNEGDICMKFKRWMKMQNNNGDTALIYAARFGYLHIVKRFVEVDRQYNLGLSKVVGFGGKTALDLAVEREDHEMVKLLTDDEGDPYSDFVPYSTAMDLFQHVRNGDLDHIKTVELNVLLNSRDEDRMSVLSIATECDQLDCCKEILKRCPSLLYHHDRYKCSVLHHAAYREIYRLIDFFVSAGLDAAKSEGGTDNMICFKKWINLRNCGNRDTALILAVNKGSLDIVKRFAEVDHQYKLGLSKITDSRKRTALQRAMDLNNHKMIKTLTGNEDPNLDYGANSNDGNFPISIAQQTQEPLQTGNISGTGVMSESNIFTFTDVSKHNNLKDCWPLINDKVHNVTKFSGDHPGCDEVLLKARGKDATTDFKKVQCHGGNAVTTMDEFYVGVCDSITSSLNKLASDKPQPYSRIQLKEFTKDFSQLLGSGGFGDVYEGQFSDGVFIAVKILKSSGSMEEVMEKQFVAEVDTIGRAYHRNLIKLYGYCYEPNTKFKALVFDYMEKGSFDTYLFKKKLDISWVELHNIAKQIAQGISYLHESCSPQIIHQDIKPSNVLLDVNLSPKVTDFGLAKVVNVGENEFEQTKIKGSRNYMAPEVNQPKKVKLSCKVDVYSFGMMLFDILGSKRNHVDKRWFPDQVWEKYDTNQFDKFILECGIQEKDEENAKRLATIAFLCVEHDPRARPKMSNVVTMLEGKIELGKPVAPFYPNYFSSESSSMSDSRDYY